MPSRSQSIRTSIPSSSLPLRIPSVRGVNLTEHNADVLGLSVPYKKIVLYHFENYLRLDREFVMCNYPELTSDFDKDHQGGDSVYLGSLEVGSDSSSSIPPFKPVPPPVSNDPPPVSVSCTPVSSIVLSLPGLSQRTPIQVFRRDTPVMPHTVNASTRVLNPLTSTPHYQTRNTYPICDISNPIATTIYEPVIPVEQDYAAPWWYPDYSIPSAASLRFPDHAAPQLPVSSPDPVINPVSVPDTVPDTSDRVPYPPVSIWSPISPLRIPMSYPLPIPPRAPPQGAAPISEPSDVPVYPPRRISFVIAPDGSSLPLPNVPDVE